MSREVRAETGVVPVAAALTANALLAFAKFGAYALTGSAAMLSEALHSVADCFNQVTLLAGILASRRAPDPQHPYGFGRARWGWAMISALGVLFIGSGVSIFNGVQKWLQPEPLGDLTSAFAVLLLALILEGASFALALRETLRTARDRDMSFLQTIRLAGDPSSVAVLVEDGVAVAGVFLAAGMLGLADATGNPRYDAAGSIAIGTVLAASAVFLIRRNLDLLEARSLPESEQLRVEHLLRTDPIVLDVSDVKTTLLGPDRARFKAEIRIDGAEVARRYLEAQPHPDSELQPVLEDYSAFLVDAIAAEIDRLEARIREEAPVVRHVDLEIDRNE